MVKIRMKPLLLMLKRKYQSWTSSLIDSKNRGMFDRW